MDIEFFELNEETGLYEYYDERDNQLTIGLIINKKNELQCLTKI